MSVKLSEKQMVEKLNKVNKQMREGHDLRIKLLALNRVGPLLNELVEKFEIEEGELKLAACELGHTTALMLVSILMPTVTKDGDAELRGCKGMRVRLKMSNNRTQLAGNVQIINRANKTVISIHLSSTRIAPTANGARTTSATIFKTIGEEQANSKKRNSV